MQRRNNKAPLKIELYDLSRDPGEQHDVASRHPEVVRKIREIMAASHRPSKLFPIRPLDR
jgi:hypothetical protein